MNAKLFKFLGVALIIIIFFASQIPAVFDSKTRLIFCNVGEGDGAILITPKNVFLIDAGRDSRMVKCLNRHLPVWKKEITGVILTHPDADHMNGLNSIIESYSLKQIFSNFANAETRKENETQKKMKTEYQQIIDILRNRKVIISPFVQGDEIIISVGARFPRPMGGETPPLQIKSLWPLNPGHSELYDTNLFSTVLTVQIGESRFLMLGDSEIASQIHLLPEIKKLSVAGFNPINKTDSADETHNSASLQNINNWVAVKVSHHGSAKNFSYTLINELMPRYAIISVGKNSYGHPGKKAIELLNKINLTILATDGKNYNRKTANTKENGKEFASGEEFSSGEDIVFECEEKCELKE